MSKRSGRKRQSSDTYSLPQVAAMLMATAELWMHATEPGTMRFGTRAEEPARESAAVVHADLLRRLHLDHADPQTVVGAFVDMEAAVNRLSPYTQGGISRFVEYGPVRIDHDRVEFAPFQARHVVALWREMNGRNDAQPHTRGPSARDVRRVPAAVPR